VDARGGGSGVRGKGGPLRFRQPLPWQARRRAAPGARIAVRGPRLPPLGRSRSVGRATARRADAGPHASLPRGPPCAHNRRVHGPGSCALLAALVPARPSPSALAVVPQASPGRSRPPESRSGRQRRLARHASSRHPQFAERSPCEAPPDARGAARIRGARKGDPAARETRHPPAQGGDLGGDRARPEARPCVAGPCARWADAAQVQARRPRAAAPAPPSRRSSAAREAGSVAVRGEHAARVPRPIREAAGGARRACRSDGWVVGVRDAHEDARHAQARGAGRSGEEGSPRRARR